MKIGDIVKVMKTGDDRRDMLYAGWIGKIRNWAVENGVPKFLVDSDGPGVVQAVSFVQWFPESELEVVQVPHVSTP